MGQRFCANPATRQVSPNGARRGMTAARHGCLVRVFDAGPELADRYTIAPPRWAGPDWHYSRALGAPRWACIGSGPRPFDPQGYGQHVGADVGPHLGRRIAWADLPPDVQRFALATFPAEWCGSRATP